MGRTLRCGVIGTGNFADVCHIPELQAHPHAEVVAIAGGRSRAEALAKKYGIADVHEDYRELCARDDIDAVTIVTRTVDHRRQALAAFDGGKHVFCESPLALDLDEARRMRDTARRTGRLLQVGLLMRSVAAYGHVEAVTRSGEHGRLLSVTTWRLGSYLHADAPGRKAHYGDPSTELMTFDFDFILWLMGEPQSLSASAARTPDGRPGEISALLSYSQGRHATVIANAMPTATKTGDFSPHIQRDSLWPFHKPLFGDIEASFKNDEDKLSRRNHHVFDRPLSNVAKEMNYTSLDALEAAIGDGHASAQSVLLFILVSALTLLQFRFAGRRVFYG